MKKYRLKEGIDPNDDLSIGTLPNYKKVLLGNEYSHHADDFADFVVMLIKEKHILSVREAVAYAYDRLKTWNSTDIFNLVEKGKTWPIELGLVEEVPEEPKRVYMDRHEALRLVYEGGKKVAYDSDEWRSEYQFISLNVAGHLASNYEMSASKPLNVRFNQKRWYVVEDK